MASKTISAENTHDLLRSDPAAILVCGYENEQDFRKNELEGAISLSEFQRREQTFPEDENIIFYCACPHDETATKRAEEYRQKGFVNVQVLEGGVNAWRNAGYGLVGTGT